MWKERQDKMSLPQLLVSFSILILSVIMWIVLFNWNKVWGIITFISCMLVGLIISILRRSFNRE